MEDARLLMTNNPQKRSDAGTRLRLATASVDLPAPKGQKVDAPLRVAAMMIEGSQRLCIISCDVMLIPRDVFAETARRIASETGITSDNLLISATHTHHVPRGHFNDQLVERIVEAATMAARKLDAPPAIPDDCDVDLWFGESQEATVGMNSRYLLKDGSIAWYSYKWEDVVRPTGPHDPDLPVLSFRRRRDGAVEGMIFNHSTHNIGALDPDAWSPGYYGLAARELERRHGGLALFLPGAIGSSHNTGFMGVGEPPSGFAIPPAERMRRITDAAEHGLSVADSFPAEPIKVLKRPFTYRVRDFNEEEEDAIVKAWAEKHTPDETEYLRNFFREFRGLIRGDRGKEKRTWLQVVRIGEIALVALPGQLFASLGLEIRRRSPFRWTYVVGLANDDIGYIGDAEGYHLGGYQLWPGKHCPSASGTGEVMVERALEMLSELVS